MSTQFTSATLQNSTVLAVDDTPGNLVALDTLLSMYGVNVITAPSGEVALKMLREHTPDLILLDVLMGGIDGFETCVKIKAWEPTSKVPVIFLTSLVDTPDKIKGFQCGAVDYIEKPFNQDEILARVKTHLLLRRLREQLEVQNHELEVRVHERTEELSMALTELEQLKNRLQQQNAYLKQEIEQTHNFTEIIGDHPKLDTLLKQVEMVAPTDSTVLITGESGTGKELIARAIHNASPRKEHSLVKVNCGAISAGLVESELFGHEKGAFTGAVAARQGRFELADGGTLFLDEVGEIPHETQVKLLRALQEREFERVGGTKTISVNVRVIAATNRDLQNEVNKGNFREDLFYRFNVFPLHSPPLRERGSDIPLLANHFLRKFAKQFGKELDGFSAATIEQMATYGWPGNIRELQNTVERAAILATDSIVELDESSFQQPGGEGTKAKVNRLDDLQNAEKEIIIDALRSSKWKIGGTYGAAAKLNLAPSTLRDRIRKLEIERPV